MTRIGFPSAGLIAGVRAGLKTGLWAGLMAAALLGAGGCAAVKPYEREVLADPIMDPNTGFAKQTLREKFFSTREGSSGGGTGLGGGCGCSK